MKKRYYRPALSPDMELEVNNMMKKIEESFGIKLTKVQASKIIAWKSKSYSIQLTSKKLLEILGDKI